MPPKIAVITGPTATGKTVLGTLLALSLNGEVVSADSMQIYREMDIGTAKPSKEDMMGVPHHMIDVAEASANYSAARYAEEAAACVDKILARGKLPVVVGGSGLYVDSLVLGRSFAQSPRNSEIRAQLSSEYDFSGGEEMLKRLWKIDPQRAQKLHPADKRRIVRALEVYSLTGRTITEHDEETKKIPPRYDAAYIILNYKNREDLYARIDERVDKMIEVGLFEEVSRLLSSGISDNCTAMQAIGYKEAAAALRGEIEKQEAVDLIKRESRRYAKRQVTWLNSRSDALHILWEKAPDFDFARRFSTKYLADFGIK